MNPPFEIMRTLTHLPTPTNDRRTPEPERVQRLDDAADARERPLAAPASATFIGMRFDVSTKRDFSRPPAARVDGTLTP